MPYDIIEGAAGCPKSRPYGVRKRGSDRNLGCHPSRVHARAQQRALYASEATLQEFNALVSETFDAAVALEDKIAAVYRKALLDVGHEAARRFESMAITVRAAAFAAPHPAELHASLSEQQKAEAEKAQQEVADRINEILLIPLGLAFLGAAIMASIAARSYQAFDEEAITTIRDVVEKGLREGLSITDTAAAIMAAFEGTSPVTAQMLARTQVTALVNEASLQSARSIAGRETLYKVWETMRDAKVRPAHARAQGQARPLDAPFDVGGYSMMYPGDPAGPMSLTANCRCVLTYTKGLALTASGSTFGGAMSTMLSETFARIERDARLFSVLSQWIDAREQLGTITADAAAPGPEWNATLVTENSVTPDNRMIGQDALDHRDLPLPLMALFGTGPGGHEGAQLAGRIDQIERSGENYLGSGVIDAGGDAGAELIRLREAGMPLGVSVDLAIHNKELRAKSDPMGAALEDTDALEAYLSGDAVLVITQATILGATVVPMQAIDEANQIDIVATDEQGLPAVVRAHAGFANFGIWADGIAPSPFTFTVSPAHLDAIRYSVNITGGVVTAAADFPLKPPAEWFEAPDLDGPVPLTYTDDGRIFGYLAPWEGCHLGWASCVPPPHSSTEYAYFHTGLMECEDGKFIPVGKLMFCKDGGKHANADPRLGAREAAKHYDDSTKIAGYVRAGEDRNGIWLAGALRPGLTEEDIHHLRLCPPSGDWRPIPGLSTSELIAAFSVPVGGYPMPQAEMMLVASAGEPDRVGALIITPGWIEEDEMATQRSDKVSGAMIVALAELAYAGDWLDDFANYTAEERRKMAKSGEAMPDGSYPIANCSDAENAIRSQGRGQTPASQGRVVAHIKKRVSALGCSGSIFDNYK